MKKIETTAALFGLGLTLWCSSSNKDKGLIAFTVLITLGVVLPIIMEDNQLINVNDILLPS
jgi:hypothetical protein